MPLLEKQSSGKQFYLECKHVMTTMHCNLQMYLLVDGTNIQQNKTVNGSQGLKATVFNLKLFLRCPIT